MRLTAFCAALTLVATACAGVSATAVSPGSTQTRSGWITAWLTSPRCGPPCWEGITPGKTSVMAAREGIAALPYVGELTQAVDGTITADLPNNSQAILKAREGTIQVITLDLPRAEYLALEEVIRQYKEPSEVILYSCQDGICEVELHWSSRGLILVSVVPDVGTHAFQAEIGASAAVGKLVMVEDTSWWIEEYPQNDAPPAPWHGYGVYP